MGRISALTELTAAEQGDQIPIVDVSTGTTKRITVKNLTGLPDLGWTATGESWSYASWDSDTRTGTITVPTDATIKYGPGMRTRFSQSTGGTKYGIITKVTATVLTIFFPDGTTLNNEAISSPVYSVHKAPLGFPLSTDLWALVVSSSNARSTTSTSFTSLVDELVIPVGSWHLDYRAYMSIALSTTNSRNAAISLSSNGTTETDPDMTIWLGAQNSSITIRNSVYCKKEVNLTAETTYTLMGYVNSTNISLFVDSNVTPLIIRAISTYL
jgi:hypothetical protein